ncbi:SDR family NAD(P)-dependent oxidoreductase [Nonomuraea cypriaca]|uniref:SDR family NAD(P)-dependent oxidoreductase n=1 Tax=Nonomuraea cypriaca TaxID=1187855 RepID=UPI002E2E4412|nr:SDR family NAD(P)-dependent oxidoreductase [Nonomuraea cypriaca]
MARRLALTGDTVLLTARDLGKAERAAGDLGLGEAVVAYQLDVADHESVERLARGVRESYGQAHVLVNNAAIHYDTWQRASDADLTVVREALGGDGHGRAWRSAGRGGGQERAVGRGPARRRAQRRVLPRRPATVLVISP